MKRQNSDAYLVLGAAIVFAAVFLGVQSDYWLSFLSQAVIYMMLALSLQLILGFAGQFSLAHAAFFGIGAYTSAILTLHFNWPFVIAFIVAGAAAAVFSILLAPMAKLRELYFAMSSLAFNMIISIIFANGGKWTGGWIGLVNVPYPDLFGWYVDTKKEFFALAFPLLVLQYLFMKRLTSGRLGRNFRAIRDDQLAAASIGVNIGLTKMKGFIIGCFWAGLAGSLMVHMNAFVSPEPFNFSESITVLLMIVLGGLGSFPGALLGGFGVTLLNEWLKEFSFYRPIIYGLFVILMMIFWPNGLYGFVSRFMGKRKSVATVPTYNVPTDKRLFEHRFKKPQQNDRILLETVDIAKSFGGVTALKGVSLKICEGEIFGLIGPNGAGKTTLINVVTGLERPTNGRIIFDDKDVTHLDVSNVARSGMVRTFQTSRLFNSMTVLENVVTGTSMVFKNDIGQPLLKNKTFLEEEQRAESLAMHLIRFVGLEDKAYELCGNLAYGHRRLVEIARALAAGPKMLLMDEPAAGLNLKERHELIDLILRLKSEFGTTVLIVEHDLKLILETCDRVACLNFGEKIADGAPEVVVNEAKVVEAYLGRRSWEYA